MERQQETPEAIQPLPADHPCAWLDKVSDEELDAMFLKTANEARIELGFPLWEDTPAGKADLARRAEK